MDGDIYGLHRVVGEAGVLPQQAKKLDPSLPLKDTELLIDVERLNIDSASFQQLKQQANGNPKRIAETVASIVRSRGKMHNPVTGSGGMLMGRVRQIGARHPAQRDLRVGDRIATLASLTLTPLVIEEVQAVHPAMDRVDVRGYAILFATGLYAKLPGDVSDEVALAALDVCGAPALVARHIAPGMTVAVLGTGKSGILCLAQARRSLEGRGKLVAADFSNAALAAPERLHLCDLAVVVDATQAVQVLQRVADATQGALCDVVINCTSMPGTEAATILSVRAGGTAIFFSMATQFTAAALLAEGMGKDITLLIGNGYVPGHAELTLSLLRSVPGLRALFEERFASRPA